MPASPSAAASTILCRRVPLCLPKVLSRDGEAELLYDIVDSARMAKLSLSRRKLVMKQVEHHLMVRSLHPPRVPQILLEGNVGKEALKEVTACARKAIARVRAAPARVWLREVVMVMEKKPELWADEVNAPAVTKKAQVKEVQDLATVGMEAHEVVDPECLELQHRPREVGALHLRHGALAQRLEARFGAKPKTAAGTDAPRAPRALLRLRSRNGLHHQRVHAGERVVHGHLHE